GTLWRTAALFACPGGIFTCAGGSIVGGGATIGGGMGTVVGGGGCGVGGGFGGTVVVGGGGGGGPCCGWLTLGVGCGGIAGIGVVGSSAAVAAECPAWCGGLAIAGA